MSCLKCVMLESNPFPPWCLTAAGMPLSCPRGILFIFLHFTSFYYFFASSLSFRRVALTFLFTPQNVKHSAFVSAPG